MRGVPARDADEMFEAAAAAAMAAAAEATDDAEDADDDDGPALIPSEFAIAAFDE